MINAYYKKKMIVFLDIGLTTEVIGLIYAFLLRILKEECKRKKEI